MVEGRRRPVASQRHQTVLKLGLTCLVIMVFGIFAGSLLLSQTPKYRTDSTEALILIVVSKTSSISPLEEIHSMLVPLTEAFTKQWTTAVRLAEMKSQ
jgi:hypothetical protein